MWPKICFFSPCWHGAVINLVQILTVAVILCKCKGLEDSRLKVQTVFRNDLVLLKPTLINVLRGLEKVVFYYAKQKEKATVDFAFGMQFVQGKYIPYPSIILSRW